MNIVNLLKQSEGKTLEFKRDLSSPTNILRTIIAFANTAGGVLIIGVEDVTHYVVGIKEPHELEISNQCGRLIANAKLIDLDMIVNNLVLQSKKDKITTKNKQDVYAHTA